MSTPTPMPRTCGEISCDECNDRYAALAAECDQLRAKAERLKTCGIAELAAVNSSVLEYCKHWEARAERAEAELAKERARLDSGQILLTVAGERVWHSGVDLRAAIDAAMQEAAK